MERLQLLGLARTLLSEALLPLQLVRSLPCFEPPLRSALSDTSTPVLQTISLIKLKSSHHPVAFPLEVSPGLVILLRKG